MSQYPTNKSSFRYQWLQLAEQVGWTLDGVDVTTRLAQAPQEQALDLGTSPMVRDLFRSNLLLRIIRMNRLEILREWAGWRVILITLLQGCFQTD